ncbi:MAG: hypothetical protein ACE5K8_05610 [Candidatus Zixiibacteriota bacterium]
MARKGKIEKEKKVGDYRRDEATRKNNPPTTVAPTYEVGKDLFIRDLW